MLRRCARCGDQAQRQKERRQASELEDGAKGCEGIHQRFGNRYGKWPR